MRQTCAPKSKTSRSKSASPWKPQPIPKGNKPYNKKGGRSYNGSGNG